MEVGGVEPPSESTSTGLSPGADGYCGSLSSRFPSNRQAVTPSHDAWAGQLFPASRTPHQRRLPRPVASPVQTAALIRQRQQLVCCCLIYKLPIFRMLGASARWSRLHTPVETGTPPCRRKKRCSRRICRRPWTFRKCSGSLRCPSSQHRLRFAGLRCWSRHWDLPASSASQHRISSDAA